MQREEPVPTFRVRAAAAGWSVELLDGGGRSLGQCTTSPCPDQEEQYQVDKYGRMDEIAAFQRKHAAGGFKVGCSATRSLGLGF